METVNNKIDVGQVKASPLHPTWLYEFRTDFKVL